MLNSIYFMSDFVKDKVNINVHVLIFSYYLTYMYSDEQLI